jgi:hypothetical protein
MEIKIEKGVPIPARPKRADKYPFAQMEVGDSFAIPSSEFRPPALIKSVAISAYRSWALRNKSDWKFKACLVENGVRIWRTA